MGSTPRQHQLQLPMPARSTEVRAECYGQTVLTYVYEDEQMPASYFVLGKLIHDAIEYAIKRDVDLAYMATSWWDPARFQVPEGDIIEGGGRGWDSMFDDYQRFIAQWFHTVHPDSERRHPFYDDYTWPPEVERRYVRGPKSSGTKYGLWGRLDAVFERVESSEADGFGARPRTTSAWSMSRRRGYGPARSDISLHFQFDGFRYAGAGMSIGRYPDSRGKERRAQL